MVYEASDLRKYYAEGQVEALRGVSFVIREREFLSIVGQSGSGKSTLLQMLGGLDRPSSGALRFRGRALHEASDLASYRARDIGFIFQAFHLLPAFTALENVQMPMFEREFSTKDRRERAEGLLELVGLGHRLHHHPGKLSGGEKQRVAIARSLANEPRVLLADEPTGNLDTKNAGQILELLTRLREERQMTLIMVTHDQDIARLGTRIVTMRDGVLHEGVLAPNPAAPE